MSNEKKVTTTLKSKEETKANSEVKQDKKEKNYVNPFVAWGLIALELIAIFVIYSLIYFVR